MQELRLVAVSEDGTYLVLATAGRGTRFTLPVDDRLRAAVRGHFSRLGQFEIEVESPLRPKEIQARIRSGETAEEIAESAGIPVERVRWFEGPVLQEREYMAQQAQRVGVRRPGETTPGPPLGETVEERLGRGGVDLEEVEWDSWKCEDSTWRVRLSFFDNGRPHAAEWLFDPRRRHVSPLDEVAARLTAVEWDESLSDTVTPLIPRRPAMKVVSDAPDEQSRREYIVERGRMVDPRPQPMPREAAVATRVQPVREERRLSEPPEAPAAPAAHAPAAETPVREAPRTDSHETAAEAREAAKQRAAAREAVIASERVAAVEAQATARAEAREAAAAEEAAAEEAAANEIADDVQELHEVVVDDAAEAPEEPRDLAKEREVAVEAQAAARREAAAEEAAAEDDDEDETEAAVAEAPVEEKVDLAEDAAPEPDLDADADAHDAEAADAAIEDRTDEHEAAAQRIKEQAAATKDAAADGAPEDKVAEKPVEAPVAEAPSKVAAKPKPVPEPVAEPEPAPKPEPVVEPEPAVEPAAASVPRPAEPAAPKPAAPKPQAPRHTPAKKKSSTRPSMPAAQTEPVNEPAAAEAQTPPAPPQRPAARNRRKSKGKRASVPSWDEIMFGARRPE